MLAEKVLEEVKLNARERSVLEFLRTPKTLKEVIEFTSMRPSPSWNLVVKLYNNKLASKYTPSTFVVSDLGIAYLSSVPHIPEPIRVQSTAVMAKTPRMELLSELTCHVPDDIRQVIKENYGSLSRTQLAKMTNMTKSLLIFVLMDMGLVCKV